MKPAFRFTLLMSLLVHLLVLLPLWLLSDEQPSIEQSKPKTLEVAIVAPPKPTPIKPPIQQAPKPPPPKHLEDDITKANTTNGLADKPIKGQSKAQPTQESSKDAEAPVRQMAKQQEKTEDQATPAPVRRSNQILLSDHLKKQPKQTQSIKGDQTLNAFAAEAQERARWYNEVLKRINEQVKLVWVKPHNSQAHHRGLIHLILNENGFLEKAWVKVPSGDIKLDQSALRALHQVYRYDVPYDKAMFEYYRVLSFNYSGGTQQ